MLDQRTARHWIGSGWLSIGAETPSITAADGKAIGSYFDGGEAAAAAAIDAADAAVRTESWPGNGMGRATALSHLADVFATRLDELIETLYLENGKLKGEASYEVAHTVRSLRFATGLATQILGRVLDAVLGKRRCASTSRGVSPH